MNKVDRRAESVSSLSHRWALAVVTAVIALGLVGSAVGQTTKPAEPKKIIKITGRALTPEGLPVEGARVTVEKLRWSPRKWSLMDENLTTDADGRFTIDLPDPVNGCNYYVIVHKVGRAIDWRSVSSRKIQSHDFTFTLGPSGKVAGQVVDEAGRPIAGAAVRLQLNPPEAKHDTVGGLFARKAPHVNARTDTDGRFALGDLPVWATFACMATADGMAAAHTYGTGRAYRFNLPGKVGDENVKIVLADEVVIRGRVIDQQTGKPVAGVAIKAACDHHTQQHYVESVLFSAEAVSDPAGRFELPGLPIRAYQLRLNDTGRVGSWAYVPTRVDVKAAGPTDPVEFNITRGALVEVKVVDEATGKPIEKAGVTIKLSEPDENRHRQTDASGLAAFRIPAGPYQVTGVYKNDYDHLHFQSADAKNSGEAALGQTRRLQVAMTRPPQATGVVIDPAGVPVEGATVGQFPMGRQASKTNAAGEFSVTVRHEQWRDTDYLIVRHLQRNLVGLVPIDDTSKPMKVALRPAATLTGSVVDPDGVALPGVRVLLYVSMDRFASSVDRGVRTDDQGRYKIPAVPVGEKCYVHVQAEGYGDFSSGNGTEYASGDVREIAQAVLPRADQVIAGIVVDADGTGVANQRLWVHGKGQPHRESITDAAGRFRVENVCAGTLTINVRTANGSRRASATAGQTDVRIDLSDETGGLMNGSF